MKTLSLITFLALTGSLAAQIDTRISPAPLPAVSKTDTESSHIPIVGFLSDTLAPTLQQELTSTFAVSESTGNENGSGLTSQTSTATSVTGTLGLFHQWDRSSVFLEYAGGDTFATQGTISDSQFHRLSATESLRLGRWNISIGEQFGYLPQSTFGFDASHVIGNSSDGSGSTPLQGVDAFLPKNVIERTIGTTTSAQYVLGPTSSLSFTGAFSDLEFSGPTSGLAFTRLESTAVGAEYDKSLDASDSVGLDYTYGQGRAIGTGSLLTSHSVLASYTRKIGQHLSVHGAAGPQFASLNFGGMQQNLGLSASVQASASFELRRATWSACYSQATSASSAYFLSSHSRSLCGALSYTLTQKMQASVSGGHAWNTQDALLNSTAFVSSAQDFGSTFLSVGLERAFNRMLSGYVNYTLQIQDSNTALCVSGSCASVPTLHAAVIGLRFHIRPLALRP